jgi:hypothetical protein
MHRKYEEFIESVRRQANPETVFDISVSEIPAHNVVVITGIGQLQESALLSMLRPANYIPHARHYKQDLVWALLEPKRGSNSLHAVYTHSYLIDRTVCGIWSFEYARDDYMSNKCKNCLRILAGRPVTMRCDKV